MRLCGLLLTLSLVLAEELDLCDNCPEEDAIILDQSNGTDINSSFSEIKCLIHNQRLLRCNLTDSLSEDAQYSASFRYCNEQDDQPLIFSDTLAEYSIDIERIHKSNNPIVVKINISTDDYWYIICQKYEAETIEILDPPQNITALIESTNLAIRWSQPKSIFFKLNKCLNYELKINNEVVFLSFSPLDNALEYNKTHIEPTRAYRIQMRARPDSACASNEHWSDWSKPVVVDPSGNVYQLNAGVIISIALVLPMILLAILLVCKFQRIFEKVFPSIPNPSKNVQMLLEKNDFNQVTPPKQNEEGTKILEVIE